MKERIKRWIFGKAGIRRITMGIAKGMRMRIDPRHDSQLLLGLAEKEIAVYFKKMATNVDMFLDIGAAYGYYSILFGKLNPVGRICSFDADLRFELIQKENWEINNLSNHLEQRFIYVGNQNTENMMSIDSLLESKGLSHIKILVKIDVEGAEYRVLQGMHNTLSQNDVRLIIETHSQQLESDCISCLREAGYETQVVKNAWWRIFIPEKRIIDHNRWLIASRPKGPANSQS